MAIFTFFNNQTTNATSDTYTVQDGGFRVLKATGTFNGATLTVYADFGDDDFAPIQAYQFTQADVKDFVMLKTGMRIQVVLASAGGSTNVSFKML